MGRPESGRVRQRLFAVEMNRRKNHSAQQGIVASADLSTMYKREIFFSVDPATLDYMDGEKMKDQAPRSGYIEFQPEPFLKYLPEIEAEIFWLLFVKRKNQKDVAKLLGVSQPTVSYRFRRTLVKLSYIMVVGSLNVQELLKEVYFLTDKDREILFHLIFSVNQEIVGRSLGLRQSSVKWVFVKTLNKLRQLEKEQPEKWSKHLALILLLSRNLGIRVIH